MTKLKQFVENSETDEKIINLATEVYQNKIINAFVNKCGNDFKQEFICDDLEPDVTLFEEIYRYPGSSQKLSVIIGVNIQNSANTTTAFNFVAKFVPPNLIVMCADRLIYDLNKSFDAYGNITINANDWYTALHDKAMISTFIHEFVHFLDYQTGISNKISHSYQHQNLSREEFEKKHFNSPDEINAHALQQIYNLIIEILYERNISNKKEAFTFLYNYLKNGEWRKDAHFMRYYNALNPETKQHVISRIYKFFTSYFERHFKE